MCRDGFEKCVFNQICFFLGYFKIQESHITNILSNNYEKMPCKMMVAQNPFGFVFAVRNGIITFGNEQ